MSSPDSPLVTTDALDRSTESLLVGLSLLGALGWPLWLGDAMGGLPRTMLAVASVAMLFVAWRFVGWCGGARRVRRGVWSADGHWSLEFADGESLAAELTAATRCVGPVALLAWCSERGRSYVLVSAGRGPRREFRRLAARLQLDGDRVRADADGQEAAT